MLSIYVDDNFLVDHKEVLDEAIDQIESTFNIKIQMRRMIIRDVNS